MEKERSGGMEKPNLRKLYEKIQSDKKAKIIAASVLCCLVALTAIISVYSRSVLEVSVNDRVIGYVQNDETLSAIKEKLKNKFKEKLGGDVEFVQVIEATPVKAFGHKIATEDELLEGLEAELTCKLKAVAINIEGKEVAVVKDRDTAENVLAQVKQHYIDQTPGELIKIEVEEKVKLVERYVYPNEIINSQEATNLILKGSIETRTYEVVEGDNLWSISRRENIPLEDLIKANPQLKSENELAIGDIINLTEVKPLLNVSLVKKVTYQESIPFETQIVKDDSMWTWDQKVKQAGEKGTKEVAAEVLFKNGIKVSEKIIGEKVIKEPVTQIVAKGTKAEVAFRGSGRFIWPVVGQITSPFGKRGKEFHSGIDIAQSKGTPVYASNSGTVTFAGWSGGYGNLVIINHGGGIETYYAHNSAITVSVGQQVEKGQQIAKVGSTGRSTGSHVHFEIRINGSPVNPLNYLNK